MDQTSGGYQRLSHPWLSRPSGRCPITGHRKHAGAECVSWARSIFQLSGLSAWLHHFSGYHRGLLAALTLHCNTQRRLPSNRNICNAEFSWKSLGLFTGLELEPIFTGLELQEPKSQKRPQWNTAHHTSPGDKIGFWLDILCAVMWKLHLLRWYTQRYSEDKFQNGQFRSYLHHPYDQTN